MKPNYQHLCQQLGYDFKDQSLLIQALTHRSAKQQNNERLEFLGDAVLGLIIAEVLSDKFPEAKEGQLSKMRASLVRGEMLAQIAQQFNLGEYLILGVAEYKSGSHHRASILEDAVEALIGAIYCDTDLATAKRCILSWFDEALAACSLDQELNDAKTQLQELLQKQGLALPIYETVTIEGAEHQQIFTVSCKVPELVLSVTAQGTSRKRAEQSAAIEILNKIEKK